MRYALWLGVAAFALGPHVRSSEMARAPGGHSAAAQQSGGRRRPPLTDAAPRSLGAAYLLAGDRAAAVLDLTDALVQYEWAIAYDPRNYDALRRGASVAADLAEFERNSDRRARLIGTIRTYADRALALAMSSASAPARVALAAAVHAEILAALRVDPCHAGALHLLGLWNLEAIHATPIERLVAHFVRGGTAVAGASWEAARVALAHAAAAEPHRIIHHLALGRLYVAHGALADARTEFQAVLAAPVAEFNDPYYKAAASQELELLWSAHAIRNTDAG